MQNLPSWLTLDRTMSFAALLISASAVVWQVADVRSRQRDVLTFLPVDAEKSWDATTGRKVVFKLIVINIGQQAVAVVRIDAPYSFHANGRQLPTTLQPGDHLLLTSGSFGLDGSGEIAFKRQQVITDVLASERPKDVLRVTTGRGIHEFKTNVAEEYINLAANQPLIMEEVISSRKYGRPVPSSIDP